MPKAHIVLDYQNIHLTGHNFYCPEGEAKHLCLIHPLHFANQALRQRNLIKRLVAEQGGQEHEDAVLESVHAYRGLPSNRRNPKGYGRSMAARSEWTKDKRVNVHFRSLKYYDDGTIKEKGVDVLVALKLITLAAPTCDDIVILAAHDTDQEPALEMAHALAGDRIEIAGWREANNLKVKGLNLWNTRLDDQAFQGSIDRKFYS